MSNKPKCFTRYNNSGGKYVICDVPWDESKRKTKDKKDVKVLITPEEFIERVGKDGYTQLSKAQQREYHRLDMANRRKQDKELYQKAVKDVEQAKAEIKAQFTKEKKSGSGKGKKISDMEKKMILSQAIKDYNSGKEVDEVKLKKTIGDADFKTYKSNALSKEEIMAKQAQEKDDKRKIVRANLKKKIRNITQRIEQDKKDKKEKDLKKIKRARDLELERVGYDVLKLLEGANAKKSGVPKSKLKTLLDSKVGNPKLVIGGKTYKDLKYTGSETIRSAINRNPILKKAFIRAEQSNNRFLSNNNKPP